MNITKNQMPAFNAKAKCPKCGYEDIGARYRQQGEDTAYGMLYQSCSERIERYCRMCGFEWPEAPLEEAGKPREEKL